MFVYQNNFIFVDTKVLPLANQVDIKVSCVKVFLIAEI